jgi:hypothetical protein
VADVYIFVGPYVECLSPEDIQLEEGSALDKEWARLLDDHTRMDWAMPGGNPRVVRVNKRSMFQYCGIPLQKRAARRWPMFFEGSTYDDGTSLDWARVNPGAEIEWFWKAYAPELLLLGQIFSAPPLVKWGLVYWPRL